MERFPKKPFIKLLHTINSGYFYDVNRNELMNVSDESYRYLQQVLESKADLTKAPEELMELVSYGYLSEHRVQKIQHPMTEHLPYILDRRLRKVTLQVTQQCNFRCRYCVYSCDNHQAQRQHSNRVMSQETAFKAIDYLAEHSVDADEVNIGFYGGEPLLNLNLVEQCIEYAHQKFKGKKHNFALTTNASLLDDHAILLFAKNDVNLMISFDGPAEIQNKNRIFPGHKGGTYDLVRSKIQYIQTKYPEYAEQLAINMVIDPQFDFELVRSLEDDPVFQKVRIQTSSLDDEYTPDMGSCQNQFYIKNEYQGFLAYLCRLGRIRQNQLSKFCIPYLSDFERIQERMMVRNSLGDIGAPSGPCVPGQVRLFVTADGKLFPCERVSENADCLCMGTIETGIDLEKAEQILNIGSLTEEQCRNCWAADFCNVCAKAAVSENGYDVVKKLSHCQKVRSYVTYQLLCYLLFHEAETIYGV